MPQRLRPNARETENFLFDLLLKDKTRTSDYERLTPVLDAHRPVFASFVVEDLPAGFPPQAIRKAWIGLGLPVRAFDTPNIIPVLAADAIHSLQEAGRNEAVDWWKNHYEQEGRLITRLINPFAEPQMLANVQFLIFGADRGVLKPVIGEVG